MFENVTSDIKTRIEDRPRRPVPAKINEHAEMPWLASKFNPANAMTRPTTKTIIAKFVSTGIPVLGTLIILGGVAYLALKIFGFYAQ